MLDVICNFMRTLYTFVILIFNLSYSSLAQNNPTAPFLRMKGTLSYPIKNVSEINDFNSRKHICDLDLSSKSTIFYTNNSSDVNAVFKGKVAKVALVEDIYVIIIEYGKYFFTYAGVVNPIVKEGDIVNTGQIISSTGKDFDDRFCVEIYFSNATKNIDPFPWFRPRCSQ